MKLIVKEYKMEDETTITFPKGYEYSYFVDEETGKTYRPTPDLIFDKDLTSFVEVQEMEW